MIESRRPSVSNLFISHWHAAVISVGVPVVVDGKPKYALTMSLSPAFIPGSWSSKEFPHRGWRRSSMPTK